MATCPVCRSERSLELTLTASRDGPLRIWRCPLCRVRVEETFRRRLELPAARPIALPASSINRRVRGESRQSVPGPDGD